VAAGNGLETEEAILCLRGEGPADLRELVVVEAAEMLRLGYPDVSADDAQRRAEAALASGRPLERFARMVESQGGDASIVDRPGRLRTAPVRVDVRAERSGPVVEVAPRPLGEALIAMGGGRTMMHQPIHPGVGFEVRATPGDTVAKGDVVGTVHAKNDEGATLGSAALLRAVRIGAVGEPVVKRSLVGRRVAG